MSETVSLLKNSLTNPSKNQNVPPCEDDAFKSYVKEISKIKSLSSCEEKTIAKQAYEGD